MSPKLMQAAALVVPQLQFPSAIHLMQSCLDEKPRSWPVMSLIVRAAARHDGSIAQRIVKIGALWGLVTLCSYYKVKLTYTGDR